jgi:hypothetical protein
MVGKLSRLMNLYLVFNGLGKGKPVRAAEQNRINSAGRFGKI